MNLPVGDGDFVGRMSGFIALSDMRVHHTVG